MLKADRLLLASYVEPAQAVLRARLCPDIEPVPFLARMKTRTIDRLAFTRKDPCLDLEELAVWLVAYDRPAEALAVSHAAADVPSIGDYVLWTPIQGVHALASWVAETAGAAAVADECRRRALRADKAEDSWDARERDRMGRILNGFSTDWPLQHIAIYAERGEKASQLSCHAAVITALSYMRLFGGRGPDWPMSRIELALAEHIEAMRTLKRIGT